MKILLFPDIVTKLDSNDSRVNELILNAKEALLEITCHKSFLNAAKKKLPQIEALIQTNGTLFDIPITDADRKDAIQQGVDPEYIDAVAIAQKTQNEYIWTDIPFFFPKIHLMAWSTDEMQEYFKFESEEGSSIIEETKELYTFYPEEPEFDEEYPPGHPLASRHGSEKIRRIDKEVRSLFREDMKKNGIMRVWVDDQSKIHTKKYTNLPFSFSYEGPSEKSDKSKKEEEQDENKE